MAFLLLLESPWAMPARPCGGLLPPLTFLPKASQRPRAARSTKGARSSPLVREGLELEDFDVEKARLVGLISSQSYALVAGSKTAARNGAGLVVPQHEAAPLNRYGGSSSFGKPLCPFSPGSRLASEKPEVADVSANGWFAIIGSNPRHPPGRTARLARPVEFGRVGREGSPRPSTRGRSGSGRDAFPWRSPFA